MVASERLENAAAHGRDDVPRSPARSCRAPGCATIGRSPSRPSEQAESRASMPRRSKKARGCDRWSHRCAALRHPLRCPTPLMRTAAACRVGSRCTSSKARAARWPACGVVRCRGQVQSRDRSGGGPVPGTLAPMRAIEGPGGDPHQAGAHIVVPAWPAPPGRSRKGLQ